jgi:hypothetical protein
MTRFSLIMSKSLQLRNSFLQIYVFKACFHHLVFNSSYMSHLLSSSIPVVISMDYNIDGNQ